MRSSSPLAETRMPVRIGRVSSREAERDTRAIVSTNAGAGIETTWSPPGSGSGGKSSARSVRMWKRAVPPTISTSCSAGPQLERDVAAAQRADDVEQQAGREHDRARALDLAASSGTRRPTSMSVARSSTPASPSPARDLDAGERLHGAARRRDARRPSAAGRAAPAVDVDNFTMNTSWRWIGVVGAVEMCDRSRREAAPCGRCGAQSPCTRALGVCQSRRSAPVARRGVRSRRRTAS